MSVTTVEEVRIRIRCLPLSLFFDRENVYVVALVRRFERCSRANTCVETETTHTPDEMEFFIVPRVKIQRQNTNTRRMFLHNVPIAVHMYGNSNTLSDGRRTNDASATATATQTIQLPFSPPSSGGGLPVSPRRSLSSCAASSSRFCSASASSRKRRGNGGPSTSKGRLRKISQRILSGTTDPDVPTAAFDFSNRPQYVSINSL